jgi:cytochrome-b5 reductase
MAQILLTATRRTQSSFRRKRFFSPLFALTLFNPNTFSTMSKASYNPPSLSGKPHKSLVPPGQCQFTEDWTSVPLLERIVVSKTSSVLRFGLPDTSLPMNLSTCACILAKASIHNKEEGKDEDVIRPYTPISTNELVGSFDLLIKDYGGNGMSNHMCKTMAVGDQIDFKHIPFNVKLQAPFSQKKIIMMVGGTGITPMIQALHAILGGDDNNEVVLFYGSRTEDDILGRDLIDSWAKEYPNKLKVVHILSDEPTDASGQCSAWKGRTGYITADVVKEEAGPSFGPDSGDDAIVFVCGPPPMYNALCGPRGEEELKGLLADMGYKKEQVYKF